MRLDLFLIILMLPNNKLANIVDFFHLVLSVIIIGEISLLNPINEKIHYFCTITHV